MRLDRRGLLRATGGVLAGTVVPRWTGTAAGRREVTAAFGSTHQEEKEYEPLGSVKVPGAREAAVAGETVYVATRDGFAVVDISDPGDPVVLAERRDIETNTDERLRGIWDLWPWADRLAVAGPAQFAPAVPNGVALFDVSDPARPEQVGFHPTEDHIHNIHFSDGIVYLTGRDQGMSVVMVDVTGDDPVEVGRWSPLDVEKRWADVEPPLRSLHDVYVQNGRAYLPYWDAGTWIVDVSDPSDPSALGRAGEYTLEQLAAVSPTQAHLVARTPGGAAHYARVNEDGTVLLVGRESWAIDDTRGTLVEAGGRVGGASGVDLYDVSDPASPEHLSTVEPPASFDQTTDGWFTTAHNADIRDGRLYTSWYFGGVAIHDVSDPARPVELARWQDPRETSFWTAQEADGVVVASSAALSSVFRGLNDTREAVYVFPDEAGSQADPPLLTDWPEDLYGAEPENRPEAQRSAGGVSEVVDIAGEPDNTTGETDPDDGRGDSGDTDDAGTNPEDGGDTDGGDSAGPGLGVGAALAGVGGYLLAQRAGHLSDSGDE
jgi:hypothetical protein